MLTSVRLDANTERLLDRIARETGRTRSEVIREAIARLADPSTQPNARHPYLAVADLVGSVRGGPSDLSSRTGEKFREALREAQRKRPR